MTRLPCPFRSTSRRNTRAVRYVAVRLVLTVSSHLSSGSSQSGRSSSGHFPTTAAHTSRPPSSSTLRRNSSSTAASSRRSAPTIGAPPSSSLSASARSRPWWKWMTTRLPSRANSRAQAPPIPPEAPVTRTRLPASPVSIGRGYDLGIKAARPTADKALAMTLQAGFDEREIGLAVLEALDPDESLTPEELDHRAFRLRQLLEHGYELEDAMAIARADHVDLDVATALVADHGCSSRLAVRILL